jgi:hypothetical protein
MTAKAMDFIKAFFMGVFTMRASDWGYFSNVPDASL